MKEGWTYKKLGEVFSSINNGANIRQIKGASGIPITRIETLSNDKFNRDRMGYANIIDANPFASYILNDGDILMSHINSMKFLGRAVAYYKKDEETIIHGMNLLRLIPTSDVQTNFMILQFQTSFFKEQLLKISHQSVNQASFNITNLKGLNVVVPSLSEQQAIVSRLDSAFAHIDALKANAEKQLEEARKLFQAELTEAMKPKEGWGEKTLIEVYNFIDYRGATPNKIPSGVPLITAKNVKFGYIDYTIKDFISREEYEKRKGRGISRKGDILFTTEAPLGNVAIADLDEFSAGQRLITLQQYEKPKYKVANEFYYFYMLSSFFQNRIKELATGATAQGIKAKLLKTIVVPIPSFETQQEIVSCLDALSANVKKLEELQQKTLAECDALKQAMLREVFE